MGAIGLNPIRLDRIGLDPIRINAIKLGVPGAVSGTDRPYIDPEVLASLKAVCICYGKSNDDPDRAVVKNLVDPDNPFIISNAAYEGMSGHNGYPVIFGTGKTWIAEGTKEDDMYYIYTRTSTKYNITQIKISSSLFYTYIKRNGELTSDNKDIPSFKLKVTGLDYDRFYLVYHYLKSADVEVKNTFNILSDGIYELPKSFASNGSLTETNSYIGLSFIKKSTSIPDVISNVNVTIEVLPEYEGAFVTDGVDDLITSTKTMQEMLGGSSEITVVSMIHQIGFISSRNYARNNYFIQGNDFLTNTISAIGKIGIYGYKGNLSNIAIVNDILGDKKDYSVDKANPANIDSVFSVNGTHSSAQLSQLAWYWTIIANKALTTDQINQVIAYFNLDRTLNPDILCNTIKQGITNENHAEFGDKLIDFSGNGRDIQLNNIAWKGNSGIGKYETDLSDARIWTQSKGITSSPFSFSYNGLSGWILFANTELTNSTDMPSFKIQIKGLLEGQELIYRYYDSTGNSDGYSITKDGEYTLPSDIRTAKPDTSRTTGFQVVKNEANIITITQIPSHAGGLCLDGVTDFGKVTGMPVYKDYTLVVDREVFKYNEGVIASKSYTGGMGAFIFEHRTTKYSFGLANEKISTYERAISYMSKYVYNGDSIQAGASADGDSMWLGTYRDNDSRFIEAAIYSLMSFPYSMSDFLIERQLKKHKLGTLYPDMVEWRPIINVNIGRTYNVFEIRRTDINELLYYYINGSVTNNKIGSYLPKNTSIRISVKWDNNRADVTHIKFNGKECKLNRLPDNTYYTDVISDKSPQKIDIYADEYIRYENIVQPYPVLLRFNDENGNEVSWGGKLKVGSTITRIGSIADPESNLLNGLYSINGLTLNGKNVTSSTHIVEKQMVFKTTATYLLDNNEPKVILSPSRLRIPNSSYKILGYIPDISGHGNHGVINNSAYAEGSGVNEDGSYQFDGVDDFVTIPTTVGGKQVLMKVNIQKYDTYIYDQRNNYSNYLAIVTANKTLAYQYSNQGGKTYIDGILNEHIIDKDLVGITHNITVTNSGNATKYSPIIGATFLKSENCKMALYDFMLFDEISTDDKIQELNEYVGIEGNVWGILTQLSNSTLISNETLIKNE